MSLQAAFPDAFALDPDMLIWRAQFTWSAPDLDLLRSLWAHQVAQMAHLPDFWSWTEALVADLHRARSSSTSEVETDAIDCARFITCLPALHAARSAGQMGSCYDWIWTAVAPTHVRGQRVNQNTFSFLDLHHAPGSLVDLYLLHVPLFAGACFYVAYKFGGLDELTAAVARGCWAIASELHQANPDDLEAFEAMTQIVIWAGHRDWPDGQGWSDELVRSVTQTQSPRQKLLTAMTFMTPANQYVDGTPQDWAAVALRDHRGAMVAHESLQVYALALTGPADWHAHRAKILAEIASLRLMCTATLQAGESDLEVLEQRVSIIHPLVFALLNWGEIEDLVAVLGTWYRAPGVDPADANLLAIVPTHGGGAAYLWPGGRWLTGSGDFATHDAMQRASGAALGSYFRGSQGDDAPEAYEGFRFDINNTQAGHDLEDAMAAHYRFAQLRQRLPADWTPRATLVFPSGPEPVQALLAKVAGLSLPLEISFECARPTRPIRRVAVWAGGPWHENFELEAIRHVADRAGWTVDVRQSTTPTREDLRRFYEDGDADVAWVISHGAHDPFAIAGTGIHLPDETLIELDELRGWRTPGKDRRLLVLNSCSSATAQGRGGLARIGLAQSLVSARQLVVGHLWPIHWTAALAFGAALAACLEDDPVETAVLTATGMVRQPEPLLSFLESKFQPCEELLDRLRRSREDLSSIVNWGCPVVLT